MEKAICLSKQLAGVGCYGCGLTKAVMHFIHFDFKAAWEFNQYKFSGCIYVISIMVKNNLRNSR